MNEIVPSNTLAKQGVTAVAGIAGGIGMFILGALPGLLALIAGGLLVFAGGAAMTNKEKTDRKLGPFVLGAGVLAVASAIPFLQGISGFLVGLSGVALLGLGVWNGIKFLRGMKSRT